MIRKITHGFVIQNFNEETGLCTSQEFICGDDVSWENAIGEPVDCNNNCKYQTYDMVQPDE